MQGINMNNFATTEDIENAVFVSTHFKDKVGFLFDQALDAQKNRATFANKSEPLYRSASCLNFY